MAYPIFGPTSGPQEALLAFAKATNAKKLNAVADFIREVYRLAELGGFDPFMMGVQSALETDNWQSDNWNDYLNPGGIGIEIHLQKSPYTWKNGAQAARALVAHHFAYTGKIPSGLEYIIANDPRFSKVQAAGLSGTVKYWSDYGNGRWAVDPKYFEKLKEREKEIRVYEPAKGEILMEGLAFPLYQTIVPKWQTNQRPGIKQKAIYINVHETGNRSFNAHAKMHSTWLLNGAQGGADTQVSVHFFVDDHEGYQMLPLDEVAWNAGCGSCQGNYAAISIELCVNSNGDYNKAWRNVASLVAALMKELDIPLSRVVMHQYWSGKWCPTIMLEQGLWVPFKDAVQAFYNAGAPAVPAYASAKPVLVNGKKWDGSKDVVVDGITYHGEPRKVKVIYDGLSCRVFASLDAPMTRKALTKDTVVTVVGWVDGESVNGERRWWITRNGTRFHTGGTLEKPSKPKSVKQPKENPYDLLVDGKRIRLLAKPLRIKANRGNLKVTRYAKWQSDETRKPLDKNESFTVVGWSYGTSHNGNNKYWTTPNDSRVWCGGTDIQPS